MPSKVQINPRVTPAVKAQVEQVCKERGCTVGELVEAAVQAYLSEEAGQGVDDARLVRIEVMLKDLHAGIMATRPPDEEEELPPIATYEQLYGPIEAAPQEETGGPPVLRLQKRGWLSRLLWREV